jgi:hypothetical protein
MIEGDFHFRTQLPESMTGLLCPENFLLLTSLQPSREFPLQTKPLQCLQCFENYLIPLNTFPPNCEFHQNVHLKVTYYVKVPRLLGLKSVSSIALIFFILNGEE